ncbi:unnamed protein product [Ceutorhynchus assimilis]|uniref:MADF domain-containing protein n=1 Tax=Ceutorhynchus assimilis TaxID=467358 RepID=A0A9N9QMR5_9CUCU|nr:unnamed protein product [Ceutorhynchus assimilis]
MDDGLQIEQVSRFPALFNKKDPRFRSKTAKEAAWITIGEIMDATPEECSARFVVLRAKYTKLKKEIKLMPSGAGAYEIDWPHFDAMGFLDPFLSTRKTTSNMPTLAVASTSTASQPSSVWSSFQQCLDSRSFSICNIPSLKSLLVHCFTVILPSLFTLYTMEALKKRQRFSDHDDLVLLREVLSHNPFKNPALWQVIQENVSSLTGKTFVIRTLREHLERLIKLWLEMFRILKDKSGLEVISTEKDTSCSNIYDLMKEFKVSKKKKTSFSTSKTIGIDARNQWTQLLEASGSTENIGSESIIHEHGTEAEGVRPQPGCSSTIAVLDEVVDNDFDSEDDMPLLELQQQMSRSNLPSEAPDQVFEVEIVVTGMKSIDKNKTKFKLVDDDVSVIRSEDVIEVQATPTSKFGPDMKVYYEFATSIPVVEV